MHVVIIGYGATGRETANLLLARGDTVRVAQRKRPAGLPAAAEFAATDVLDAESVRRTCAGCDAVICCIGFYHNSRLWERASQAAMENMLRRAPPGGRASSSRTISICTARKTGR